MLKNETLPEGTQPVAKVPRKKKPDFIWVVIVIRPFTPTDDFSITRPVRTWTFAHTKSHAQFLADDLRQKGHFIVDVVKTKAIGKNSQ